MSRHDDAVRLRHMLEHAREAATLVRGKKRQDLDNERVLSLALVRLLEIIGEAAGRVTKELQAQNPGVAWPQIMGLRNRLIHGYDSVDMDILWQILTADLPRLIVQLETILATSQQPPPHSPSSSR
jgi:uncharacterized protein with HEPN domain